MPKQHPQPEPSLTRLDVIEAMLDRFLLALWETGPGDGPGEQEKQIKVIAALTREIERTAQMKRQIHERNGAETGTDGFSSPEEAREAKREFERKLDRLAATLSGKTMGRDTKPGASGTASS